MIKPLMLSLIMLLGSLSIGCSSETGSADAATGQLNVKTAKVDNERERRVISNGYDTLFGAVSNNNMAKIEEIISESEASNNGLDYRQTALVIASYLGSVDIAEQLLKTGARVDGVSRKGKFNPLMAAALNDQLPMIQYLLENSADINYVTSSNRFPLGVAVRKNNVELCRYLLENGARISPQGQKDSDAFFVAAEAGVIDAAQVFLDSGIDINAAYRDQNALHYALKKQQTKMAQFLLGKDIEVNPPQRYVRTSALIQAAILGDTDLFEKILAKTKDVNFKDDDGFTALMRASANGYPEIVSALVERKPDMEVKDKRFQRTAIVYAGHNGHAGVLQVLLGSEDKQNGISAHSLSFALVEAIKGSHVEAVKVLVEAGADLNESDIGGGRPLFIANRTMRNRARNAQGRQGDESVRKAIEDAKQIYELLDKADPAT
ncbi:hypothetical protein MNBD_GAMMA15-562 [hydrothermal vent metagenome]|uniref:Uncharacterized protein n=1 Tax=hydrothermal vent metagenome TaxID=652676 RepID=A0A3B0YC79_9ZZZZ